MIRSEQSHMTGTALEDSTPTSEHSMSFPGPGSAHRLSFDMSRQPSRRSRTPSRTTSPALRPLSAGLNTYGEGTDGAWALGGVRDDVNFYQIETKNLTRENQILKRRIRELGRSLLPIITDNRMLKVIIERQINGEPTDQEPRNPSRNNSTSAGVATSSSSTPAAAAAPPSHQPGSSSSGA